MSSAMTHEPTGRRQTRMAAASGWIGSALEYYDFFIYATAASLVFPQTFFPSSNPTVAIVASLATYGVGYVARPVGAFVLGHYGDVHGRRNVLLVCLFLMGLSTMAVGVVPTYAQAGVWAPVLLVILRLIQGFAVAGEISGASSMILEHAPFGRRGYFAWKLRIREKSLGPTRRPREGTETKLSEHRSGVRGPRGARSGISRGLRACR